MDYIIILLLVIIALETTFVASRSVSVGTRSRLGGSLFVDTSALMDGRIVTAAQTGFIPGSITVPRSVINELQLLADQADSEKRARARRGLDAVQEMRDMDYLDVTIFDDGAVGDGGVDQRLVDLAKRYKGSICTIDFNLNKVASVQGIRVLNINELAGGIRMAFLPGETISLTLNQKGQSSSQAVGYLADGTMVVVDKASSSIGKTVEVEFIRSLQTAAGRMMFAKLVNPPVVEPSEEKPKGRRVAQSTKTERSQKTQSTKSAEPAATPNARQSSRRSRKPRTKEDSLIELVNQQQ